MTTEFSFSHFSPSDWRMLRALVLGASVKTDPKVGYLWLYKAKQDIQKAYNLDPQSVTRAELRDVEDFLKRADPKGGAIGVEPSDDQTRENAEIFVRIDVALAALRAGLLD
ncbi:MAG: hypothetical protein Q4G51_15520 [Dermatophilus congolensis]|nr:hypothetical protein [Dermatophilus congolensis]